MKADLRASWTQALLGFLGPLVGIFLVRWLLIEPYVIPSGSMLPNLWVHDHIFVNKLAYGIHWPMSKKWIIHWSDPKPNDIVVFRYPESPEVFYVKRVVAVAGDEFEMRQGQIWVNGSPIEQRQITEEDPEGHLLFEEPGRTVQYLRPGAANFDKVKVPDGHFYVVGDNRDQSNDSRFWGAVPTENAVGRAALIWLSCEETLPSAKFLCDPKTLRFERMFKSVR